MAARMPEFAVAEVERLVALIDPWRKAGPSHAVRTSSGSLRKAYEMSEQFRRHLWTEVDEIQLAIPLLAAAAFVGILLYATLRSGNLKGWGIVAYVVVLAVLVIRRVPRATAKWEETYRRMYFRLATTNLPMLIASFEDGALGHDSGDEEATAGHLIGRMADDIPAALLRAARLPDEVLSGEPPAQAGAKSLGRFQLAGLRLDEGPLDIRARARYCAIFDFFFNPQESFNRQLDRRL
jgi:hypothetical protein